MKTLIHVVVGAGFPGYFENSLFSVLSKSTEDVLAIYNRVGPQDCCDLSDLQAEFPGRLVDVLEGENAGHPKTGRLYAAYNRAIDYAAGKYSYVSFVQGDMQMIQWPLDIIPQLEDAFESSVTAGRSVFAVGSAMENFGALGSSTIIAGGEFGELAQNRRFDFSRAVSDVAIYSLDLINSQCFRFEGHEGKLSSEMVERGYCMSQLREPSLAFLPWPATVRAGRRRGRDLDSRFRRLALSRLSNDIFLPLPQNPGGGSWQESLTVPSGFRTLWPYWPTDIFRPKWFSRRRHLNKALGLPFLPQSTQTVI